MQSDCPSFAFVSSLHYVFGDLAIWRFGDLAIWRFGDLAIWRFGDLAIWRFGDLATTFYPSLKKLVSKKLPSFLFSHQDQSLNNACAVIIPPNIIVSFMANFNTHLTVALVASATIGLYGITSGVYGLDTLVILVMAGGIGGLLPDIDLENSRVSRIGFHWASLFLASYMAILYATFYQPPIVQTLFLWAAAYGVLRYGVFAVFSHLTRHRGMVHSVPYMAVLSLICVYLFYYFLPSGKLAWLFGGFVFFGSIVHLLLDELYSVNIYGLKLKKSFGSAFKFISKKQLPQYVLLYALLFVLYVFAPAKNELSFLLTQLSQG